MSVVSKRYGYCISLYTFVVTLFFVCVFEKLTNLVGLVWEASFVPWTEGY